MAHIIKNEIRKENGEYTPIARELALDADAFMKDVLRNYEGRISIDAMQKIINEVIAIPAVLAISDSLSEE